MVLVAAFAKGVDVLVFINEKNIANHSGMTEFPKLLLQRPRVAIACASDV